MGRPVCPQGWVNSGAGEGKIPGVLRGGCEMENPRGALGAAVVSSLHAGSISRFSECRRAAASSLGKGLGKPFTLPGLPHPSDPTSCHGSRLPLGPKPPHPHRSPCIPCAPTSHHILSWLPLASTSCMAAASCIPSQLQHPSDPTSHHRSSVPLAPAFHQGSCLPRPTSHHNSCLPLAPTSHHSLSYLPLASTFCMAPASL